jgi:hypothetical protein
MAERPEQLKVTPKTTLPPGGHLPRNVWVTLNRIRTGVGRFHGPMHKWELQPSQACECGCPYQNAKHILNDCSLLGPRKGT